VVGDLKATEQKKQYLQENSMRIELEAKEDPGGIYFKSMRKREPRSSRRIS
jgi:hypothetical protein